MHVFMQACKLNKRLLDIVVLTLAITCMHGVIAQGGSNASPLTIPNVELRLQIASSLPGKPRAVPAVLWLKPVAGTPSLKFTPSGNYTLLQKNRTFIPHLLVIPLGSVVRFPNADPFFHNVFSLYQGKRFDLGLYEAGSSKSVTFSREGVSYIFCNIHPEMSAVVLTLSTPIYAIADKNDSFALHDVPPGDYMLHLWIESVPESTLRTLARPVHIPLQNADLGTVQVPIAQANRTDHPNMYGAPYDKETHTTY
jgi:plastocyanin